ncbi:dephospho-CoA kinase [Wenjunlia tyrosinilytica]|uniref:Dephospho-CoA kinase n=2 Tax=Wenjunlia tyrosinilytica TaxID=1544741 RepID=A0A918DZ59_9ACTN|nr:dephospho-CoA kinase [Wenjunlia tyrosinilytica]
MLTGHECFGCQVAEHGTSRLTATDANHEAAAVLVEDAPPGIGRGAASMYHLVVYIDAPADDRVRRVERLVKDQELSVEAARIKISRILGEECDAAPRAAVDVVVDNSGPADKLWASIDALWAERLARFESNMRWGRMALYGPPRLVPPDPTWPEQAARLAARIQSAAGERALRVDHIGSTAIPGLSAKDVIDLQVSVPSLDDAIAMSPALTDAGLIFHPGIGTNQAHGAVTNPAQWRKRYHKSADPGRPANVHIRPYGTAGWRFALLFRDWLRADPQIREEYLSIKRTLARRFASDADTTRYGAAKDPWFAIAYSRMEQWATQTGWHGPEPAPVRHPQQ